MVESETGSGEDPAAYRLFNEIGIIDQLAQAAFRKVLPRPLNVAMFGVLNHFVRLGDGKTPSFLAEAFQVTRPSMTNTLGKLETAGFVRIEDDPEDGRTKRVRLTAGGRKARMEAVKATEGLFAEIGPALARIDIERLVDDLGRVRVILDQARN